MVCLVKVLCHMPGGGVIAAEGGAAGLAGTQVYPGTIMFDAFFTDVVFRCLNFGDGFQMRTECHNEIIYAGRKICLVTRYGIQIYK